jgi:hypothetical protein
MGAYPISKPGASVNPDPMQTRVDDGQQVKLEQLLADLKVVVQDGREFLKSGASKAPDGLPRSPAHAPVGFHARRRGPVFPS